MLFCGLGYIGKIKIKMERNLSTYFSLDEVILIFLFFYAIKQTLPVPAVQSDQKIFSLFINAGVQFEGDSAKNLALNRLVSP